MTDPTRAAYMALLRDNGWKRMDGPGACYVHPDGGEVHLFELRDWGDGIEEQWRYLARHERLPGDGDDGLD